MRRFSLLLVSLIVLTVQTALAQNFSVKGTVVSAEDNEPLIGAQWKFSGDKHKSLQVDTERTFHQRYPLAML